jgi:transposase
MSRKIRTLTLKSIEEQELLDHRDHDPRPSVRERCSAILKIAEGHSAHWVAQNGLLKVRTPDTVYDWLNAYEAEKIAGLEKHQQGGPRRRRL